MDYQNDLGMKLDIKISITNFDDVGRQTKIIQPSQLCNTFLMSKFITHTIIRYIYEIC